MSKSSVSASNPNLSQNDYRKKNNVIRIIGLILINGFIWSYIASEEIQKSVLGFLFPDQVSYTHSRIDLWQMTFEHLGITILASLASITSGVILGVVVTRKAGKSFLPFIQSLNSMIQTLPPSAILILAFPLLGFGWEPSFIALFLYSLFPVLANTIVGFLTIPPKVLDAAQGMGLNTVQRLFWIEFPLAFKVILTGIRYAIILNIGTATIAAVLGGGGVGTIIISGLVLNKPALVLSGVIVTSYLALMSEQLFSILEKRVYTAR